MFVYGCFYLFIYFIITIFISLFIFYFIFFLGGGGGGGGGVVVVVVDYPVKISLPEVLILIFYTKIIILNIKFTLVRPVRQSAGN